MAIRRIEGLLHLASEGRYAILVGRFNSFVVEHLLEGAIDTLKRHGVAEDADWRRLEGALCFSFNCDIA